MSAYAALVSLLRIHPSSLLDVQNRAQLQSLHEKVKLLLGFLEKSSTYNESSQISALETKMRVAAYKAEDLLEEWLLESHRSKFQEKIRLLYSMKTSILFPCAVIILIINTLMCGIFVTAVATFMMITVVIYIVFQSYNLRAHDDSVSRENNLRLVLYDLDVIMEDMIRIKEAHGDREMLGYATLISLRQILDSILDSNELRVIHNKAQLKSLHEKVTFLLDFLGNAPNYMANQKSELQNLDANIRGAAYEAKTLVEYQIPSLFILDSDRRSFRRSIKLSLLQSLCFLCTIAVINYDYPTFFASYPQLISVLDQIFVGWLIITGLIFGVLVLRRSGAAFSAATNNAEPQENQELNQVIDNISILVNNAIEIKDAYGNPHVKPPPAAAASSSSLRRDFGGTGKSVVVGLESDIQHIKASLLQGSSELEVISIVGMGGIGKTTLAREVYNDPDFVYHFDIHAWVTVSEKSLRNVLLGLLDSAKILTKQMEKDDHERLGEHLHTNLKGRRYLIVFDDVWDTEILDFVRRFLPDDDNGNRVLLTSRLSHVASHPNSSSPIHQMQCLNENDSWYLLREKVFGAQDCPLELESIGMKIARACKGLPLPIVVIGGVLSKDNSSKIWSDVAEKLKNSQLRQIREQCLEILGLSYNHLPHHLRPCFLYMAVFMVDSEIPVSKLIRLWAAEGFLKPCTTKSLEEVAHGYLKDLIERNLVLVCKRSCNGKIRTCSIHVLLRNVCVQNAQMENFLHVVDSGGHVTRERPDETPRRLCMHHDTLQGFPRCCEYIRSFICMASKPCIGFLDFPYIQVLDVLEVHFGEFPFQIMELYHLRYLAFHYDGPLPASMSKLQNLETIVHHHCSLAKYPLLPRVIWSMQNLRHLYVKPGSYLSNPLDFRLPRKSFIPQHLETLVGIRNFKWSEGIIKRIPKLKKLGISYDVSSSVDWSEYQLESLVNLHQLETLKITIKYADLGSPISYDPPKLAFPQNLKKLTLSGCGIPWTNMTTIGALSNLEVLKLRCEACSGPSWETVEGELPQLIFLLLEELSFRLWNTDAAHFPCLQHLVLRSCSMLEEIPSTIGDISTLELIELADCHPSAVDSAKQIQEDQKMVGNDDLKVCIGLKMDVHI